MLQDVCDMTDEEIIQMALREQAFFGHIVMRYEEKLSRYVRRLGVHGHEDRQDVLQEVFIKVYRNLHSYDATFSFSSWIYRIAHNEAISFYRKKNVRPEGHMIDEGDDKVFREMAAGEGVEEAYDKSLNAERIQEALASLETKYKDVLILRFFEHLEYEEISDVLKIPIGSVGTLIHRGKQRLQKALNTEQLRV